MSRFVKINGNSIDADKVDAVVAEHCGVCGWHYHIVVQMQGGGRVVVDEMTWDNEWGEFGPAHPESYEAGRNALAELCADIASHFTEGIDARISQYPR